MEEKKEEQPQQQQQGMMLTRRKRNVEMTTSEPLAVNCMSRNKDNSTAIPIIFNRNNNTNDPREERSQLEINCDASDDDYTSGTQKDDNQDGIQSTRVNNESTKDDDNDTWIEDLLWFGLSLSVYIRCRYSHPTSTTCSELSLFILLQSLGYLCQYYYVPYNKRKERSEYDNTWNGTTVKQQPKKHHPSSSLLSTVMIPSLFIVIAWKMNQQRTLLSSSLPSSSACFLWTQGALFVTLTVVSIPTIVTGWILQQYLLGPPFQEEEEEGIMVSTTQHDQTTIWLYNNLPLFLYFIIWNILRYCIIKVSSSTRIQRKNHNILTSIDIDEEQSAILLLLTAVVFHWVSLSGRMLHLFVPYPTMMKEDSTLLRQLYYEQQQKEEEYPLPASHWYPIVALSGFVGCMVGCFITWQLFGTRKKTNATTNIILSSSTSSSSSLPPLLTKVSLFLRIVFNIVIPLVFVEVSLRMDYTVHATGNAIMFYDTSVKNKHHYHWWLSSLLFVLPFSIQWLVHFVMEYEGEYPRYCGLCYWIAVLVMTSFPTYWLLPLKDKHHTIPVVIRRKWFHWIATILFAPMIVFMPQFMSLSFVIAICILMVLEMVRRDIPYIQYFYDMLLDHQKDQRDTIILSHIFLIVGCALPLWIAILLLLHMDVVQQNATTDVSSALLLLAQFGVLSIGIGDAMGAVIGKSFGTHVWGRNHRTIEGSTAMWTSMILVGVLWCCCRRLPSTNDAYIAPLVVATTFTTVMEAFTKHLDNFVLPLAGSTILLLFL